MLLFLQTTQLQQCSVSNKQRLGQLHPPPSVRRIFPKVFLQLLQDSACQLT
jgi:hypothetical protein